MPTFIMPTPVINRRTACALLAGAGLSAMAPGGVMPGGAISGGQKGAPSRFVRRAGMGFVRDGRPYRYVGANAWYLAWLGTSEAGRTRLAQELDRLRGLGVSNVRLLAGAEEGPLKNSVTPGFINRAGQLNQTLLAGLDHVLAELARRDMTGVLYLTNNWEWSGGMMTLLWYETGHYIDNNDPAYPWPAFPDRVADFYGNNGAMARYDAYIRTLLTRTNSVTGVRYADDPAILSWQLCNEPRPGASPDIIARTLPAYYRWIDRSVALIRSLAPHHMVSVGLEGTIAVDDPSVPAARRANAGHRPYDAGQVITRAQHHADYMTLHIWPLNWGWVKGKDLAGTWDAGMAKVHAYIRHNVALARAAGKPLVFEEFGFPRDGELYDPDVPTHFREQYYQLIYQAAETSAAHGGPVQGSNFWGWTGEARAEHPDHRFHPNDTQYMGDPPHEPQGWYGNFDSDHDVQTIIAAHARAFSTVATDDQRGS